MTSEIESILDGRISALGRRWELRDTADYVHQDLLDGPTRIQGLIAHTRGCKSDELPLLMDPTLARHMPDPSVLADMDAGAKRLAIAVHRNEAILIFGDYDVDGATSTAVLQRFLKMADHQDLTTIIPDREFGYGFGAAALDEVMATMPDVVVLLDCGTQNHDTIQEARDQGADVIVIDHHQPSHTLPRANALINPHRLDESEAGQALRNLCTAGLAFMFCVAVNRELRRLGRYEGRQEPNLSSLLDLVALGTVCDVMPLTGLNRSFVTAGLKRLDRRENGGLDALARAAGVKEGATVTAFGFHLGPRINAGGRIGRARLGADLLSSDDPNFCEGVAAELNSLNQERQAIERAVQAEAVDMVNPADDIILVAGQGWHEGVIGIVAGRLKELYNRPVIVLAIRDDGVVKGSGRSIAGVDLGHAIMDARDCGLLVGGGGHMMACGLTATPQQIEPLRQFLLKKIGPDAENAREANATLADAAIWTSDITHGFFQEVEQMGPYGQGWPKPRFILGPGKASSIRFTQGGHAFFDFIDGNGVIKAKAWRAEETGIQPVLESFDEFLALGHVELDQWRGRNEVNFIIEDVIRLDRPKTAPSIIIKDEISLF